jgi:hypothetical protein
VNLLDGSYPGLGIGVGILSLLAAIAVLWLRRSARQRDPNPSPPLGFPSEVAADPDALDIEPRRDLTEEEWLRLLDESVRVQVGLPPAAEPEPEEVVPPPALSEEAGDRTLRLLPGRLEAVSGYAGREIRFVALPGAARFTLGRVSGPRYRHVQVPEPTVSRMHAFMEFKGGGWRIGNLSETNGVVVDGRVLAGLEETVDLTEGTRVELGEVVFVFRES